MRDVREAPKRDVHTSSRRAVALLTLLVPLAVCLSILSNSFVAQSLWLDETVSAWIVSDGLGEVFSRSVQYQGQSPLYYSLLWLWAQIFGHSEPALRALSIVLLGLTFAFVARWSYERFGAFGASVAVVSLLAIEPVLTAMSARPYALGLLLSACALYEFARLGDDRGTRSPLRAMLFLALTAYAHYLFALLGLVGLILVKRNFRAALIACGGAFFLTLPGLWQLVTLAEGKSLYFVAAPTLKDLFLTLLPIGIALPACVGLCVILVVFSRRAQRGAAESADEARALRIQSSWKYVRNDLLLWWLLCPILLWLFASLGYGMFLGRYVLWAYLGLALLLGSFIAALTPQRAQVVFLVVFGTLIASLNIDRKWQVENWRDAFEALSAVPECQKEDSVVLLHSGLIELESKRMRTDQASWPYLNAPASVYAPSRNVVPVAAEQLQSESIRGLLAENVCAVIVLRKRLPPLLAGDPVINMPSTTSLVGISLSAHGWSRAFETEGDLVHVFQRSSAAPH